MISLDDVPTTVVKTGDQANSFVSSYTKSFQALKVGE